MAENLMTREEYAKHRGVSPQAISKLMGAERIPFVKRGRRVFIDPAEADFALGETQQRIGGDEDEESIDDRPTGPTFGGQSSSNRGLTQARTAETVYKAKLAELLYKERVGQLLPLEGVVAAMERVAEGVAGDIDRLPTFADELSAAFTKDGPAGLRRALKEKAREIREELAGSMRRLIAEGEMEASGGKDEQAA